MDTETQRFLNLNLFCLQHKSVLLKLLDEHGRPILDSKNRPRCATGFLTKEEDIAYLYTAWHVVTGAGDPYNVKRPNPPRVDKILIYSQDVVSENPGLTRIGKKVEHILDLYLKNGEQKKPIWKQDEQNILDDYWNKIGIKIPFWHDLIKIKVDLPEVMINTLAFHQDSFVSNFLLDIGEKVLISGFPYGYSSMGLSQPTPIILTRYVAAIHVEDRRKSFLIDGVCFPVMSGSPVFVIRDNKLLLCGVYTGTRYLDFNENETLENDRNAGLGICDDIDFALNKIVPGWD